MKLHSWKSTSIFLASLLWVMSGPVSAQGLFRISEEQEIEIGREVAREIEKKEPILNDSAVERYINGLGQRLVRHSSRSHLKYQFKVVNSKEINAFALPGGFIYVNRGLVEAAENESELVGVLGHEIAHVTERHSAEQIQRAQMTGLGLGVLGAILGKGTGAAVASIAAEMAATGAFMKFSRDAEREADRVGARLVYDAGFDPRGMITFFEKLDEMRKRQPNAVERFFSSHPSPQERRNNISDLVSNLEARGNLRRDSRDFRSIKRRLAGLPRPSAQRNEPSSPWWKSYGVALRAEIFDGESTIASLSSPSGTFETPHRFRNEPMPVHATSDLNSQRRG